VSIVALALGVALAAVAVLVVALPFLREPVAEDDRLDAPTAVESHRLELVEKRDRALGALKELEFDHRTGKVGDQDYRELLGPLRARGGSRPAGDRPGAALRFRDELRDAGDRSRARTAAGRGDTARPRDRPRALSAAGRGPPAAAGADSGARAGSAQYIGRYK